jgi:hypothetical protein
VERTELEEPCGKLRNKIVNFVHKRGKPSHNIVNMWKNYFCKLFNVHQFSDVRQIEIQTVESLVPDPSPFEVQIPIAKLNKYKSPGSDQILTKLIQTEGEVLLRSINSLILFGMWKFCFFRNIMGINNSIHQSI